ncbi:MAG TPA: FAD-dependent monooxygenase [Pseudolabrys sp.]|nr:FAD-dependent monooxygenase [Pseudolabrys sp.]
MTRAAEHVLIVGAGMCGMSLGVALARAGIRCEIIEIRPQLTEPGTGISLQGPALRALQSVGVLEQCISRGFGYSHFKACDAHGNVTGTVDLPRLLGPDYPATIGVLRQSVHEVLGNELTRLGVPIRLATTIKALRENDSGVGVEFTDGEPAQYDLVVGADGMNSAVRELIFGPQHRPHYTGQMVWRATVSRPPDVLCRHSYFGPTNKSGFNPISDKHMYVYCVQNAPERPHWADAELPGILRGLLAEFGGALGRARDEITSAEQIICRPVFSALLPPPWHSDRVIVIGDAAHATTPHLASGASIAIEDAVILVRLLQSSSSLRAVFDDFMQQRYGRCRMIVENSELLGEWEKNPAQPNQDTVGVIARSYQALAKAV